MNSQATEIPGIRAKGNLQFTSCTYMRKLGSPLSEGHRTPCGLHPKIFISEPQRCATHSILGPNGIPTVFQRGLLPKIRPLHQLCLRLTVVMLASLVRRRERRGSGRERHCLLVPAQNSVLERDVIHIMNKERVHVADEILLFSATGSRERSYRSWLHLAATVGSVGCTVVELIILGNSKTEEITFYIRFVVLGFQATFLFCFCVWRLRNKLKLLSFPVDNWRPWVWQAALWYAI